MTQRRGLRSSSPIPPPPLIPESIKLVNSRSSLASGSSLARMLMVLLIIGATTIAYLVVLNTPSWTSTFIDLHHRLRLPSSLSPTLICVIFSIAALLVTHSFCGNEELKAAFIRCNLKGKDLNKKDGKEMFVHFTIINVASPEAFGVICGLVYLVAVFVFIPVPFVKFSVEEPLISFDELTAYLSALLSLSSMILLGFADDVMDLRWKMKLILPTVASIPLLLVYYVTRGITHIVVPKILQPLAGSNIINLGILYYVYQSMLAVFCTNAINILGVVASSLKLMRVAGINGVECGQSLVIASSLAINDLLFVLPQGHAFIDQASLNDESQRLHSISLFLLLPFVGVCGALFIHNRYPAKVFVGDTFCYFAGMTFACVGILGRYSKTMLLFFLPQILNFLYSTPQLFHIVPCPRHRMPKFDPSSNLLFPSFAPLSTARSQWLFGRVTLPVLLALEKLRLVRLVRDENLVVTHVNNLTLLNLLLLWCGPTHEHRLCVLVLAVQAVSSMMAFALRYWLVQWIY